ncbi:hypothetical protein [Brevibacillus brevis]|uniref:hypothetical protein n=1 Tax=Brevibacillus brevis TaxID=1393 RepID=UPI00165D7D7F|nr:hypothetical protein [Brevibacillus brevis]
MYVNNWPFFYVGMWLIVLTLLPAGAFLVYGVRQQFSTFINATVTIGLAVIGIVYWWVIHFVPFITNYSAMN